MRAAAKPVAVDRKAGLVPATVAAVESPSRVTVTREGGRPSAATVAVAGIYAPRAGDKVLLASGADGERYVVGVLVALREVTPAVTTRDGTNVTVAGEPGAEVITIRDPDGRAIFEHDVQTGRSVVHAPAGDLEFRAEHGAIDLEARDAVRVSSEGTVDVVGATGVRLAAAPGEGRAGSSVSLDARGMKLATPALDARALRAEFALGEGRLVARTLSTALESARHVVGVVEVQAGRIIEKARNVYRDVEELSQTRAGRIRMVAEATFHLLGRRTFLKAEEDMKIKGQKIHLA